MFCDLAKLFGGPGILYGFPSTSAAKLKVVA
jgi:hypothetical protein